jgi:hypothetical protein
MTTKLLEAALEILDELSESSSTYDKSAHAHKTARNVARGSEGTGKAEFHSDGSASVHFNKPHPHTGSSTEHMARQQLIKFGLGFHPGKEDREIPVGHKETQTGVHGTREFHLQKNDKGGHTIHIKPVSDKKIKK